MYFIVYGLNHSENRKLSEQTPINEREKIKKLIKAINFSRANIENGVTTLREFNKTISNHRTVNFDFTLDLLINAVNQAKNITLTRVIELDLTYDKYNYTLTNLKTGHKKLRFNFNGKVNSDKPKENISDYLKTLLDGKSSVTVRMDTIPEKWKEEITLITKRISSHNNFGFGSIEASLDETGEILTLNYIKRG